MERLARELNISTDVNFLGNLKSTKEVLNISDLFMLPSSSESFGLAALEAMMMRVPVISSNTGGLPEVNVAGKTGYLLEVGDVEGMAEKSLKLLKDDVLLEEFKTNAQLEARKFDLTKIIGQYIEVYQEALKSK